MQSGHCRIGHGNDGVWLHPNYFFRNSFQNGDPINPISVLRAGSERPCRRTTDERGEFAPLHCAAPNGTRRSLPVNPKRQTISESVSISLSC
jgi:hypothetical protein